MDQTSITGFHNYLRLQVLLAICGRDVLRKIFRERYRLYTASDWIDGSEASRTFYLKKGKNVFKNAEDFQKAAMKTGDLQQWDLKLLGAVLLNTNYNVAVAKKTQKRIDRESQNILNLVKLSQEVATLKRQRIDDLEFIYLWDGIQKVLKNLDVPAEDMEKILFSDNLETIEYTSFGINQDSITEAKALKKEGSRLVRVGEFKKAIELFTKALQLTGLSSLRRSAILAKRSSTYIQFYEFAKREKSLTLLSFLEVAAEDAKLCIQIKPTLWEGYYLAGRANLLKGDRKTAFSLFNHALSLNPNFEDIKKARDECQKVEDYEEVSPKIIPVRKTPMDQNSISKRDLADARRQQKLASWSAVVLAHRFLKGEGKEKNYSHAARLFAKAACSGNAEAAYNLGILHLRGEGVPKNETTAFQYFRLAANSSEDTLELKHIGEAESMYELGKCWEQGIGTRLDYGKAAHWYSRASQEGCGEASNRLAFLYRDGQGVPRCPQRAIQFWCLAADQGVTPAMVTLAYEYVLMGELDEAQIWYERAIERGDQHAKDNLLVFKDAIQAKRQLLDDMPLDLASSSDCGSTVSKSQLDISLLSGCSDNENIFKHCVNRMNGSEKFWVHENQIMNRAIQGCHYAQRLWKAMTSFAEGMVDLMELVNHDSSHTPDDKSRLLCEIFHHFSNCIRLNDFVASFPLGMEEKFVKITEETIGSTSNDKQSKFNLDVRVCYTYLLKSAPKITIFIDEFKQKYPQEAYFHEVHSDFLVGERLYRKGLEDAKKALEACPNNYNLLYNYALFANLSLKMTNDMSEDDIKDEKDKCTSVLAAYEAFLKCAPAGHRMIPECYYAMAQVAIFLRDLIQAEKYLHAAEKAEKNLLACFLPYRSVKKDFCVEILSEENINHIKTGSTGNLLQKINLKPPEIDVDMKLQLTNPKRCAITIRHREKINYCFAQSKKKATLSNNSDNKQIVSSNLKRGYPTDITFKQMDPTKDQVYQDCLINLVIMEDSIFDYLPCVHSVVRDDNGDFQYMYLNNMELNNIPRERLGFGAKITIFNPNFCSNVEGAPGIWIENPTNIFYHWTGDDKPLCRFCWIENPAHTCSNCKRAQYCSRECQSRDWKLLKHKLICSPTLTLETDEEIR